MATASIKELSNPWDSTSPNHARRIAGLVKLIQSGIDPDPVEMELSEYNRNLNFVNDGHHRIRAYQFLKAKGFYAELGGFERLINKFKRLCRKYQQKLSHEKSKNKNM